ncbi:unnamed protein product [Larinioides sclopetarius]|uniref:Uncharacterized protein n=1 Tax=Larinioides sclopetarius TaxID=280406 RepID=A0AAV2B385_9ARAC
MSLCPMPLLKRSDGQETHKVDAKLNWTFQRAIKGLQDESTWDGEDES